LGCAGTVWISEPELGSVAAKRGWPRHAMARKPIGKVRETLPHPKLPISFIALKFFPACAITGQTQE